MTNARARENLHKRPPAVRPAGKGLGGDADSDEKWRTISPIKAEVKRQKEHEQKGW